MSQYMSLKLSQLPLLVRRREWQLVNGTWTWSLFKECVFYLLIYLFKLHPPKVLDSLECFWPTLMQKCSDIWSCSANEHLSFLILAGSVSVALQNKQNILHLADSNEMVNHVPTTSIRFNKSRPCLGSADLLNCAISEHKFLTFSWFMEVLPHSFYSCLVFRSALWPVSSGAFCIHREPSKCHFFCKIIGQRNIAGWIFYVLSAWQPGVWVNVCSHWWCCTWKFWPWHGQSDICGMSSPPPVLKQWARLTLFSQMTHLYSRMMNITEVNR